VKRLAEEGHVTGTLKEEKEAERWNFIVRHVLLCSIYDYFNGCVLFCICNSMQSQAALFADLNALFYGAWYKIVRQGDTIATRELDVPTGSWLT
jgi:hypothetical protein